MILMIFLSGMLVSILIDFHSYTMVKRGIEIEGYPQEYLKYNKYELFRSWALWSTVWPIIMLMLIYSLTTGWNKS